MPDQNDRVKIKFPGVEGTAEITRKQFESVHQRRGATIVEVITDPAQSPGVKATAEADEKAARSAGTTRGAGATAEGDEGGGDAGSDAGRRRR